MFSVNLMLVILYRFSILNTASKTACYFIGYGLSQIPTGIILDTFNIFAFMSVTSILSFIIVFVYLVFPKLVEGTIMGMILLFIYGCISAIGMLGCMRVFSKPDKQIFLANAVICVIGLALSAIDVSISNTIAKYISVFHAAVGAISLYLYIFHTDAYKTIGNKRNEEPKRKERDTSVTEDIMSCIKQCGIISFMFTRVLPVAIIMIVSHLSCSYCFLYVTSAIRTEVLRIIGYDMTYIIMTATSIGFAVSFLISHFIYDSYINLSIISSYLLSLSLLFIYKSMLNVKMFNPLIVGIIITANVTFDNLKSVLLFRKIKTYSHKYQTTLIAMSNLSSVTISVTYSLLSGFLLIGSTTETIFLFTLYTAILGCTSFILHRLLFDNSGIIEDRNAK